MRTTASVSIYISKFRARLRCSAKAPPGRAGPRAARRLWTTTQPAWIKADLPICGKGYGNVHKLNYLSDTLRGALADRVQRPLGGTCIAQAGGAAQFG